MYIFVHSMFVSEIFPIIFAQGVDICNIKTVCVYGLPDSISQLYQVRNSQLLLLRVMTINNCFLKLFS